MAEPMQSPSLPSTADTTPYVPVSWMAVAAIGVAAAFAVTLLALGVVAFTSKKPLLEDWLLAMPVIAIVLSFAARRVIRNSEGTRTGENLAIYAWWTALVLGLCYVAYLFAIDFAIRRDARGEIEKWMALVTRGDDDDLFRAFHRTLPPGGRQGINPDDKHQMQIRFRDELLVFRTCDLLKLAQRNKDEFEFTSGAVTWSYKPGMVDCLLHGTVKCPEGTFPVLIPLKGMEGVTGAEGGGGRQWVIVRPQGLGFIDQTRATRTPYGWLLWQLERDGASVGKAFVFLSMSGPAGHLYAYRAFVAPGGDVAGWSGVAADRLSHMVFVILARAAFGDAGYAEYLDKYFFKREGGADPLPDQKKRFFESWKAQGLRAAGDRLKDVGGNAIDKEDLITITESAVEVRVPVEIPISGSGKVESARGRLVVVCTDPAVLAELKQLKASANPSQGTAVPSDELLRRKASWRVVRVESDMLPVIVSQPRPGDPTLPGGGGMPPG